MTQKSFGEVLLDDMRKNILKLEIAVAVAKERYEVIMQVADYLPPDHPLQPTLYDRQFDDEWALQVGAVIEAMKAESYQAVFPEMDNLLDKEIIGIDDIDPTELPDDFGFEKVTTPDFPIEGLREWNDKAFAVAEGLNSVEEVNS